MDVLRTESLRVPSRPMVATPMPDLRALVSIQSPFDGGLARLREALRMWVARFRGDGPGGKAEARRLALFAYTGAEIVLAACLLAWTSMWQPLWSSIDPGVDATALSGPEGGLLLWLGFGLLGSLRVIRLPNGLMTFHLPLIGAAMVLGGPTAGAWVAALSSLDRREVESQPWYGILANHATLTIGAVMGGLTVMVVAALPGLGDGASLLVASLAGALMLASVSTLLGTGTLVLRDELDWHDLRQFIADLAPVTAIEVALVPLLVLAYIVVGWWAPVVVAGFVLLLWQEPRDTTFVGRLEKCLAALRTGSLPGAVIIAIVIEPFEDIRNQYGPLVADEVLAEVRRRVATFPRRPGDVTDTPPDAETSTILLSGVVDLAKLRSRLCELQAALAEPIATSAGPIRVGVALGVRFLRTRFTEPSAQVVLRHAEQARDASARAGGVPQLYDPEVAQVVELEPCR